MKLDEESLIWAINHLFVESDTDLFPRPIELKIIHEMQERVLATLKDIDLGNYDWQASRRFVIPKCDISYRIATQLDPIDSIIISAIVYQYGHLIEAKRRPVGEKKVFGYRFSPSTTGHLYSTTNPWTEFWEQCKEKAQDYSHLVCLDISDFYNQIYHHVIDNQLMYVGFPNQIRKAVMSLLESVTQTVSRGIPVGPHAMHIFAEMSLIPVDDSLTVRGYTYSRYVDDIVIYCNSEEDARIAIYEIAEILDKQQRMILQKQKTKIYVRDSFIELCDKMLVDRPINQMEVAIIEVLNRHSRGNKYAKINSAELTPEELDLFCTERLEVLLEEYLAEDEPNYARIRWFYRRLAQVGIPYAIDYSLRRIDDLIPAISDVCQYLIAATQSAYDRPLNTIGEDVLEVLEKRLIKSNEFFQLTLLNLFVNNPELNHIDKLLNMYKASSENMKRKIMLAAYTSEAEAWIREQREYYPRLDTWSKRAMLIGTSLFPADMKKHYLQHIKSSLKQNDVLERILIDWALAK